MSYILDALRRAEAERERGSVPGLHSQTAPPAAPEPPQPSRLTPWGAAGVGGAVVLLGAAGWFLLRPGGGHAPTPVDAAPTAAKPAAAAPMVSVAPSPAPAPAPAPAPVNATAPVTAPATAPTAAPAPMAAAPAMPPSPSLSPSPPTGPVATPSRTAKPVPAPAQAVAPFATKEPAFTSAQATAPVPATGATPSPSPSPSPSPAAPPAAPPRAEARIINFDQLPEDVRRTIPPLVIGGAIYSENAASRMLIVGGQLLHEGDSAAPGVTLEQIKPRSAVLRWKQLRYEVTF